MKLERKLWTLRQFTSRTNANHKKRMKKKLGYLRSLNDHELKLLKQGKL